MQHKTKHSIFTANKCAKSHSLNSIKKPNTLNWTHLHTQIDQTSSEEIVSTYWSAINSQRPLSNVENTLNFRTLHFQPILERPFMVHALFLHDQFRQNNPQRGTYLHAIRRDAIYWVDVQIRLMVVIRQWLPRQFIIIIVNYIGIQF